MPAKQNRRDDTGLLRLSLTIRRAPHILAYLLIAVNLIVMRALASHATCYLAKARV
jgi:hypothetical protein